LATVKRGVGLVGAGFIGHKRLEAAMPWAREVVIFDENIARATTLASKFIDRAVVAATLENLLERDSLDVVIIATPHVNLATIAIDAITHGKHVFIEKPGAITYTEMVNVINEANKFHSVVRVGYNHRFHPSLKAAREIVKSAEYGDLLWVRGQYGHGGRVGYESEWRADRRISGGGELLDQGSHLIDLTRFLFGDVDLVHAELQTSFWAMSVEDNAFFSLRPRTGGFVWHHASWTEWKNRFSFEICLERAKLELVGLGGSYGPETMTLYKMSPEMGPPSAEKFEYDFQDLSWSDEFADFIGAISGEVSYGATLEDACETLRIISEVYSK